MFTTTTSSVTCFNVLAFVVISGDCVDPPAFIVAVIKLECIGPVVVVETPWGREVEAVVSAEVEPEEIDPVLVE